MGHRISSEQKFQVSRSRIDDLVSSALRKKGIGPARPCSDEVFVRRVYLDVIGIPPESAEVLSFLKDPRPNKRAALIDALLARDEYVDYWSMKWCDLLPMMAKQAGKHSIIRNMTHGNNGHETAACIVQTGRQPDRLSWPGLGAIVSRFRGYDHGYKGLIPPYVVLTTTQGRFSECGFLGPRYKPFATGGDPSKPRFEVEGVIAAGISDERQRRRRDLLHRIDTLGRAMPAELHFHELGRCEDQA